MTLRSLSLLFSVLTLGVCSCATPHVEAHRPRFVYRPSAGPKAGEGISVALLRPQRKDVDAATLAAFSKGGPQSAYAAGVAGMDTAIPLFLSALEKDVDGLLTERGLTVAGPYDSLEAMTFPEKKQADLVLVPEFSISISKPMLVPQPGSFGGITYAASGTCAATGHVAFLLLEPLSGQRMWVKTAKVPEVEEPCSVEGPTARQELENSVSRLLERVYPEVLRTADKYFSAEEMQLVKRQSAELREKKVY